MELEDDIKEGFLCPKCFEDLKSPANLTSHFGEFHSEDNLAQLRNVIGKATKKIFKKDQKNVRNGDVDSIEKVRIVKSHGTPETGGIDIALWEPQEFGQHQSHTQLFRKQRKESIEKFAVKTNKMLIRLEKLIKSGVYGTDSSLPGVLKARKTMEKRIVLWESDSEVKFCPYCTKKFTLTYRKHHCRLCGRVVCERCIGNLNMSIACNLIKIGRESMSSLVKLPEKEDSDSNNGLKVCDQCQELVLRQNKLLQDQESSTVLLQLYDKIQSLKQEVHRTQPSFVKMADAINAGETVYNIDVAMEARTKLLRAYESIEALSKKIQLLGLDREKQPHPQILKLQRSIRNYVSNYLADNMLTLPSLPAKDKYKALQKENEEKRRVKQEAAIKLKESRSGRSSPFSHENSMTDGFSKERSSLRKKESRGAVHAVHVHKEKESSWGPVQVSQTDASDPLIQQITNIKGYITQAKNDKRYDEMEMFEENLRDLEKQYAENRMKSHVS